MFKTKIKSEELKEAVSAVKAMVSEAMWNIAESGITIKAIDPANVAMVSLFLPKESFESYEATDIALGIDATKLNGLLDMAEKESIVGLELDEVKHKLTIEMGILKYSISLIDPETVQKFPKLPKIEFPTKIVLKGEDFKRGVKAGGMVSDHIHIGMAGESFIMEADGDTDSIKMELQKAELIETTNNGTKDITSLFAMDYLVEIAKIVTKTSQVTIQIGQDIPCTLGFMLLDGNGTVMYMIAPRVERD